MREIRGLLRLVRVLIYVKAKTVYIYEEHISM